MGWKPPTLGDEADRPAARVRCECGRWVTADMLVDATGLPAPVREAVVRRDRDTFARPGAAPYLCDGCREFLALSGTVDRAELARAFGAPNALVEKVERRLQREAAARAQSNGED